MPGSDGLCTLREAIGAANSNTASGGAVGECAAGSGSGSDTINFSVNGTINLTTALPDINSDMTINGPGSGLLTVRRDTGGDYRVFNITFGTVGISGLTITNGKTADGNSVFGCSNAASGGGILNWGTLTLTGVNLTGNRTGAGAAQINNGGFGGCGGAVANLGNSANLTMTDCTVTGNITGSGGAGNNLVGDGGWGGGIYNENNLTMTNSSVNGNTTGDAGTTAGMGGQGGPGGGIYSRVGVLTLTNVTVNNNVTGNVPAVNGSGGSGGTGGGIMTIIGLATITNSTISGNQTGTRNGGPARGHGGGIYSQTPMTITGTTISNNTGDVAALYTRRELVVINSTLSGNHSVGIYNDNSSLSLTNSTVTANDGTGVADFGPTSNVRNTIIAGNGTLGSPDVEGSFNTQGNNLIGVNGTGLFGSSGFTNGVNGDQVGTSASPLNARLAALANNGGLTQTHGMLPGSPALDAGNNCVFDNSCSPALASALTTDQRGAGFARKADSADLDTTQTVDIGAFEAQASVEDISDKSTPANVPLSFVFNVGDASAITNVTASSNNTTLVPNVPANLNVTGAGSTRTLDIAPASNQSGVATITVTVTSGSESMSDTFVLTVTAPPAGPPSVTPATTDEDTQTSSGLVISRNAADGPEVTHFKITNILNGTLFKNDGASQITNGQFIAFAEGNAGLKFTPAANLFSPATTFSFEVQAAKDSGGGGLSTSTTANITVNAIADLVSVTNATTTVNTQTTTGLVITKNAVDGAEVTHFKITNITNGTLFKNDGATQITSNSFIAAAEGAAGLKFTPANNLSSPSSVFSFQAQGATSSGGAGLGPAATATISVKVLTATAVSSSVNPSQFDQSVTFTATVSSNSGAPSGTVQFKDGAGNIGSPVTCAAASANTCAAQLSISTLSVGNHNISATYSGDTHFEPSTGSLAGGQVVNCGSSIVSNTNDSGAGSLRQAILGACPNGIITFAPGLTSGGPATITLTSGELQIDKHLTISGPGANLFSVSGNNSSRIFNVQAGNVTISGLSIINGQVPLGQGGGGILNRSYLTLIACDVTGNKSPLAGGGIQNSANGAPATLTVVNSTISGNEGGSFGSGIFNGGTGGATVTLINSTVALNTNSSFGGGIYNSDSSGPATLNIVNSTIAGNRVGSQGGGIYNFGNTGGGVVNLNNSIVADNTVINTPSDISNFNGNLSGNNNIIESSADHTITGSNNSNVDPLLEKDGTGAVVLKNNGGPTNTVRPAPNSPAINNGSNALLPSDTYDLDGDGIVAELLPVDQRGPGFIRVKNTTVDIGALEASFTTTTSVSSSVNPSEFGQSVTFTATVSSSGGAPTGSVQFKDGGANLGAAQTLNGGGVAQLTISSLTTGTHSITAEYLGNDSWTGSTGTLQDGQVVKPQPTLSINDVSVTEGNTGTANLTFTVTLSAASNLTVNVNYATANGTATVADTDYQSASSLLTFNPGDLTKQITVTVNGDQKFEADETLFITLSSPTNAAFGDSQGQGTILNDDTLQLLLDTSGPDVNQLAALDSFLQIRDPFRVQNTARWFTADPNTRVILFALNLQLNVGESPSVVKVTLLDGNGQTHEVSADEVRAIPNTLFTQVTFRLPDALAQGTCFVSIKAHARISNTGTFRIVP